MRTAMRGLLSFSLTVIEMALLEGNVNAQVNMPEREHVQSIAWAVEFMTLVTIVVIGWLVWRISKRDYNSKKSKQNKS